MQISDADNRYVNHIVQQVDAGKLKLPIFPETALNIQEQIIEGDPRIEDLVELVYSDAGLAAKIIGTANKTCAGKNISDVNTAVSFLQRGTVKILADRYCMQFLFQPTSDAIDDEIRQLKKRSISVSQISYQLANFADHADAHKARTAGLLCELGSLPILCSADSKPGLQNDSVSLEKLIRQWRGQLGKGLLLGWGLNLEIADSCLATELNNETSWSNHYCNIVTVATYLSIKNNFGLPLDASFPSKAWDALSLPDESELLTQIGL